MKTLLEIIIYLFSILGGIVSIITLFNWLKPINKVSWKKVEKGVIHLKEKLINSNYTPTLIVGIGRGGSIIGALLSGTLGIVPILVIDRVYEWKDKERKESFCEEIRISKNIEKVLLVAGEVHSGNTAKKYFKYFKEMGAKEVRMLTFMQEPFPTFQPDYSYIKTEKSDIKFPWMITEDYKRESKLNYNDKKDNNTNI